MLKEKLRYDLMRLALECKDCKGTAIVNKQYDSGGWYACTSCATLHDILCEHFKDSYSMPIASPNGTKVQYHYPFNGYSQAILIAKEKLQLGEVYTVDYTDIHDSSTGVYLEEFPGIAFNSCLFRVAPKKLLKIN